MNSRFIVAFIGILFLSGCASVNFKALDNDEYEFSKVSDACAAGIANSTLDFLKFEANKFCALRKEKFFEISSDTITGIPFFRCAEASLKFKCIRK